MGRDTRTLPEGWEKPIRDAIWPKAMISAVRHDAGALASERVIDTIKAWQASALDDADARAQREAKRMLRKLGDALSPEVSIEAEVFDQDGATTALPIDPGADAFTVDSLELPPKPKLRRASRAETPKRTVLMPEEEEDAEETDPRTRHRAPSIARLDSDGPLNSPTLFEADDAILSEKDSDSGKFKSRKLSTGASMPPEGEFSVESEKPTTAIPYPDSSPKTPPAPMPPPPPPPPDVAEEDDGGPTRHIDLPDDVLRKKVDSVIEGLGIPEPTGELDTGLGPERTEMGKPPSVRSKRRRKTGSIPSDMETTHFDPDFNPNEPRSALVNDLGMNAAPEPLTPMEPESRGGSLAPKPGVIRRRNTKSRRVQSAPRPRAAMHHVRALYFVLTPFASELIPLPYERRSRRFWARWREVAGDRGVRREFIEDLLRSANDIRTLVCELIAEVQTVDVRSVYALVDKMQQNGELEDALGGDVGTPDRQRGPLVGASVRVEGVPYDDED